MAPSLLESMMEVSARPLMRAICADGLAPILAMWGAGVDYASRIAFTPCKLVIECRSRPASEPMVTTHASIGSRAVRL